MQVQTNIAQKDKDGALLNAQRFQMLEDIAKELSGDVVFPTCFDVVMRLRSALLDPNYTINQIAALINLEPLISTKLLRLANSAAYNPDGREISDLKNAINRIGLNVVRSTTTGIAMKQMLLMKNMAGFVKLTKELWEHSVYAASAAQVIARQHTKINPDEAMLAGLVHDLGAFYMIYRASQYEELRIRPDTVRHLVMQWHESIGHSLLNAIGLPEAIVDAVVDHDQPRTLPSPPRNLRDIVYVANQMAQCLLEHSSLTDSLLSEPFVMVEPYQAMEEEVKGCATEMMSHFA